MIRYFGQSFNGLLCRKQSEIGSSGSSSHRFRLASKAPKLHTFPMVKIPILRWGQPYESLDLDNVIHFVTGETLAQVSQANAGLLAKDMRKAQRARDVLREIPCRQLVAMMKKAAALY